MAYISKESVIKHIEGVYEKTPFDVGSRQLIAALKTYIENVPTADVVEVVRCKDCDKPNNDWIGCPYIEHLTPPPNHYCGYGERRDT